MPARTEPLIYARATNIYGSFVSCSGNKARTPPQEFQRPFNASFLERIQRDRGEYSIQEGDKIYKIRSIEYVVKGGRQDGEVFVLPCEDFLLMDPKTRDKISIQTTHVIRPLSEYERTRLR